MLEPGVQHFFDAMEFGAPKVAHFIESAIDVSEARIHVGAQVVDPRTHVVEPRIHIAEARIHVAKARVIDENAHQDYEHCRQGGQSS
jgi:hypothetical protein